MSRGLGLLAALLLVAGSGCDAAAGWLQANVAPRPLPTARRAYAGTWRGHGMELVIAAEGRVHYRRREGSTECSLEAPLRGFRGDDLLVGVAGLTTTFHVDRPPWRQHGVWRMVVEGVELERVPGAASGRPPEASPATTSV